MGIFDKMFGGKNEKAAQTNQQAQSQTQKVLVVEDDGMLGSAMEFKLTQAGFSVTRAVDGKDGLAKAETTMPDIILLDILMPLMDGKAMLRALREMPQFKTTPVIVLTNAGEVENIKEMVDYYKASDFLIKSNVDTETIVARVKEVLSKPPIA